MPERPFPKKAIEKAAIKKKILIPPNSMIGQFTAVLAVFGSSVKAKSNVHELAFVSVVPCLAKPSNVIFGHVYARGVLITLHSCTIYISIFK